MSTALLTPLQAAIAAEAAAIAGTEDVVVELGPPARAEHGDLATPVAMTLAKAAGRPPREIAEALRERLMGHPDIADVEVAGPGFLNLRLAPAWFAGGVRVVAAAGEGFGANTAEPAEAILLEFVSPNPTGPLHVGHARQAAYSDALARILTFVGHRVTRECYVNDWGRQMELFGASLAARYAELVGDEPHMPEDGYPADYVRDIAAEVRAEVGDTYRGRVSPPGAETITFFGDRGGQLMLDRLKGELTRARVAMDRFFSEAEMQRAGRVTAALRTLEERGHTFREEGALWFRTTAFGDEKDRVLVRANGVTTYLAADVAYHLDKAARMGDRMIDVFGADHHGYIGRLRAVLASGGFDPDALEVMILQLVSLVERGEAKRMSKRAGTIVTFGELMDDIGVDATRFFLVERSHDTAFDLDLDLAREQSQENPVYYVQYAHARCCSILAKAEQEGVARDPDADPPPELDVSERALALRLTAWPRAVADAAERRAPHRVAAYLKDLAGDLHTFYHRCRVVGEAPEVQAFRMELTVATRDVIRGGLALIGVDAPERM